MTIEGKKIVISKSAEDVFTFLTILSNYKGLMPESIQKFKLEEASFSFTLKSMPEISLMIKEKIEFSQIVLSDAKAKMDFNLTANINEISAQETELQFVFEGTFNPMMAMLIKKPLTSFIESLTENAGKVIK